jgi:hypothetical protein
LEEIIEKDDIKEKRLKELGVKVLRFQDDEVYSDIENVMREIERYIREYEKHTPNPSLHRSPSGKRGVKNPKLVLLHDETPLHP